MPIYISKVYDALEARRKEMNGVTRCFAVDPEGRVWPARARRVCVTAGIAAITRVKIEPARFLSDGRGRDYRLEGDGAIMPGHFKTRLRQSGAFSVGERVFVPEPEILARLAVPSGFVGSPDGVVTEGGLALRYDWIGNQPVVLRTIAVKPVDPTVIDTTAEVKVA
jgi:hypothetical protein